MSDVGVLTNTPLLLAGAPSLAALVFTVAAIGAAVVGVPLMVHTMLAPPGKLACGELGEQVAVNPAGRPLTSHVALSASRVGFKLVQLTVWFAG
jgi:anthranilate phosphoribosyltransferase